MANTATIDLDRRQFDAALREYYAATKKDLAYVINRSALNVAIKASQRTPLAKKEDIAILYKTHQDSWWNKYVWTALKAGISTGKRKQAALRAKTGQTRAQYVAMMQAASKRIIKVRLDRVGFVRAGWYPMMKRLTALKLGITAREPTGTRKIRKKAGQAIPAVAGWNPTCTLIHSAKAAIPVAGAALKAAWSAAAIDMRDYVRRKMGATAKQFSAGR